MRFLPVFFFLIFFVPLVVLAAEPRCQLTVYTYDSIVGKGGLGSEIFPAFEKQTGCKIRVLASGDAIQTLSRVEIDLKRGQAVGDVILGVDTLLWDRVSAFASSEVVPDHPLVANIQKVLHDYPGFVPYDSGALMFMVDSEATTKGSIRLPQSLRDLKKPEWKRNFILEDPRTSSPGLEFLLLTYQVLGKDFKEFWKELRSQWLAMPSGWDGAYGLFLKGQAPLVWSYQTSQAYHQIQGGKPSERLRYRAVPFSEGQPIQVEGAVMMRNAPHAEVAKRFLQYLLSDSVQARIPTTNWMWPVSSTVSVPKEFNELPKPVNGFVLSGKDRERVLKEWSEAIHE